MVLYRVSLFTKLCRRNSGYDIVIQLLLKIMATQIQLTADLKAVLAQQKKTSQEIASVQAATDVLTAKIVELEAVIAAGGEVSPELADAVAAVKAQAQAIDDQIPDLPSGDAPLILNPLTASAQVGVAFSLQLTASGAPSQFSASPLPAGLTLDASTGLLSGTPSEAGTTEIQLKATNPAGEASAVLVITVDPAA